jgi:hypothetical protein
MGGSGWKGRVKVGLPRSVREGEGRIKTEHARVRAVFGFG